MRLLWSELRRACSDVCTSDHSSLMERYTLNTVLWSQQLLHGKIHMHTLCCDHNSLMESWPIYPLTCSVPAAGIELPWRSMVASDASDSKEKAEKSDTGRANMRANGSSSVEYFPISLAASLKSPQSVRSSTFSRYDVGDLSMCAIVCCNFPSISNQLCFNLYIYRNTQGSKAKTDVFQIVQSRLSEVVTVMSRTGENKEKTSSKLRT